MFYQVGLLPVTNNLLDISSDIYLIVQGMIRSDRLIIPGSCVVCTLVIHFLFLRGTEMQNTSNDIRPVLNLHRTFNQCYYITSVVLLWCSA